MAPPPRSAIHFLHVGVRDTLVSPFRPDVGVTFPARPSDWRSVGTGIIAEQEPAIVLHSPDPWCRCGPPGGLQPGSEHIFAQNGFSWEHLGKPCSTCGGKVCLRSHIPRAEKQEQEKGEEDSKEG